MIHPTSVVDPRAKLDPSVTVGAYAVIDAGVSIGRDCRIGPQVYITGDTVIGSGNQFHAGCVIGDAPQDLKYAGEPTRLRIGDHNTFREHVTVHRSNKLTEDTIIGSHNFLMAHSHVGHNCRVGDYVIIANGGLLGGHVTVENRVFISGNCLVHQFVRVGTLALMQGGSAISKDLPPYTIARGDNGISGLNSIGLRRAGFTHEQRQELRRLYRLLFVQGLNLKVAREIAEKEFSSENARVLLEFISSSKRGICTQGGCRGPEMDPE